MMPINTILTHPGSAHKDDFLACCILVHVHRAPVERRDPTPSDLCEPSTAVIDVGGIHDPASKNFDHHQFSQDGTPICAISLVLQDLGLYDDARKFCEWLEPAEWFDCRGVSETARWLGVERDIMGKLNSPIDVTLLRRFATSRRLFQEDPLWHIMAYIGEDIVGFLSSLRQRLAFIRQHCEVWTVDTPSGSFDALFMPRTHPLPENPSSGLPRFISQSDHASSIIAMVYPDRRGNGYGLSRHNDTPLLDFTKIASCPDVHFSHARGFVAKSSATDPARLRELLAMAYTP